MDRAETGGAYALPIPSARPMLRVFMEPLAAARFNIHCSGDAHSQSAHRW
jgi:hypothetical protein